MVAFDQVLVKAEALIERAHGSLKPPGDVITFCMIETFRIDAWQAEDYAQVAALGEKRMLVNETEQTNERAQGSGFEVLVGDIANTDHDGLREI
jgi:hypothetical protein